jgi:transcriptional regulator NrdR family protein
MNKKQLQRPEESLSVRGLICRHCGGWRFRVIYTRAARGGRVIRRRECRNCAKRVTTWERAIGVDSKP